MRGAFEDQEEYQPVRSGRIPMHEIGPPSRDAELTLGAGTLLLLFCGLVVLCGLCFGVGYAVGHHRAQPTAVAADQPGDAEQSAALTASTQAKPSASSAPVAQPSSGPAQPDASAQPGSGDSEEAPGDAISGSAGQSPASPAASAAGARGASSAAGQGAGGLMVQVAAISRAEDADVLVGALRKRGYAVNVRRDPSDGLIHVRVGPFATRDEANRWRMRLLNDGYNAAIQ